MADFNTKEQTRWAAERLRKLGDRAQKAREKRKGIRLSFEEIVLLDSYAQLTVFGEMTDEDIQEVVDLA